ncbi:MAG: TolC family protein [Gammaproteobacteria bacterium]
MWRSTDRTKTGNNGGARVSGAPLLALVSAPLLLLLSACSTTEKLDMQSDREANARADRIALEPSKSIVLDHPLTLKEVIDIGLRNNLDLRIALFERQISDDDALARRLEALPDLEANAGIQGRDSNEVNDSFDFNLNQVNTSSTFSEPRDKATASLQLTWNVLDFGVSYVRSRQAQLQIEVLEMRRRRQEQLLALELTEAYWKAALAEDALDYVRKVEAELQAQKGAIERSVNDGGLDPIAAKEVEKRILDIALSLRDLQADIASARLDLARLMGLKQTTQFRLAREPIRPILAELPRPENLNTDHLEDYALIHRPELFEQDLSKRIQRDEVRAAMLSMFPSLNFSLSGNYDSNALLHSQSWALAGANVGWNLLRLPALYAQKKSAERGLALTGVQRLQVTVAVLTQVHISRLDYAIAADRFRLYEESYRLTNDLMNMTRERNLAGLLSNLTVSQRLLEDMAAKLRRDQSVVDLIIAHRRLLTSLGVDPRLWDRTVSDLGLDQPVLALREAPAAMKSEGEESGEAMSTQGGSASADPGASSYQDRGTTGDGGATDDTRASMDNESAQRSRLMNSDPYRGSAANEVDQAGVDQGAVDQGEEQMSTSGSGTVAPAPPPSRDVAPAKPNRAYGSGGEGGVTIGPWRGPQSSIEAPPRLAGEGVRAALTSAVQRPVTEPTAVLAKSGDWGVQVGAFRKLEDLRDVVRKAQQVAPELLGQSKPSVDRVKTVEAALLRGRFPGFDEREARRACGVLKGAGMDCIVVPPVH